MSNISRGETIAARARSLGIPEAFVTRMKKVIDLEIQEDPNCPVPRCLERLVEEYRTNKIAQIELARVLDIREQCLSGSKKIIYSPR